MNDQRRYARDDAVNPGISCLLEHPSGVAIDGVIIDTSDTGARISGATEGLEIGSEYRITLVVQSDQKVVYHCVVRHLDADGAFYGIEFRSGPGVVKPAAEDPATAQQGSLENEVKRCPVDGRVFPTDYLDCPFEKSCLVLEGN